MTKEHGLTVINNDTNARVFGSTDSEPMDITKAELQLIMGRVYGMLKQKMEWKDQSITFLPDGVYFDFKKHASDQKADLTIVKCKRPRGVPALYKIYTAEKGKIDQSEDLKRLIDRFRAMIDKKFDRAHKSPKSP